MKSSFHKSLITLNQLNPLKKQSKAIGLSPDTLLFRGVQRLEKVEVDVIDFNEVSLNEEKISEIEKLAVHRDSDNISWINVNGLHDDAIIEEIGQLFGIEKFILSDVMNTEIRPKVQHFEHYIFISLKMLSYNEKARHIDIENISLIIMEKTLLSFQEREGDVFDPVRNRLRDKSKRIRTYGTDYLAFALMDIVIDNYIYTTSMLGEKVEELEIDLLDNQKENLLPMINHYKKTLNYLRRNIKPAQEMIIMLAKTDTPLIKKRTMPFYKELGDNIHLASELSDSYREILSDQLNLYHTNMSSRLNDIMRFLTIFSVIFIPLTFIVGVYGTNFDYLPELHYKHSYFIMWGIMTFITLVMVVYFKKKKWL